MCHVNYIIVVSVSTPDDQCQLEGCTRQKRREGKRIHDYCCIDHAKKDEPNRECKQQ